MEPEPLDDDALDRNEKVRLLIIGAGLVLNAVIIYYQWRQTDPTGEERFRLRLKRFGQRFTAPFHREKEIRKAEAETVWEAITTVESANGQS